MRNRYNRGMMSPDDAEFVFHAMLVIGFIIWAIWMAMYGHKLL